MTKRKQQTALAKALSTDTEHAGPTKDRSVAKRDNQQIAKRSKRQRLPEEGAAEDHSPLPSTAAEGSIDDIFRQARAKQQITTKPSQVQQAEVYLCAYCKQCHSTSNLVTPLFCQPELYFAEGQACLKGSKHCRKQR